MIFLLSTCLASGLLPGCNPGTSPPGSLPKCAASAGPIAKVSPADGETRTLRRPTFVVTMSEEIDCSKVSSSAFTLDGAGGSPGFTEPTCAGSPTAITFQPTGDLALSTSYELVIDGLVDASGKSVEACRVDFTTKSKTVFVAAGADNLALDEDGALWSWGDFNSPTAHTEVPADVPLKVPFPTKVVSASSGDTFRVVALDDGTVWTWGENLYGQLGDGTTETHATPVQVKLDLPTGVKVIAVSAGMTHGLALRSDGKVMAWGDNAAGQLGDGTKDAHTLPIEVPGLPTITAVIAAQGPTGLGSADGGYSLALADDGAVWGWGSNNVGQLGQPVIQDDPDRPTPATAPGVSGAKQIATGWSDGFALFAGGDLFGWGETLNGGAGDGRCNFADPLPPSKILVDQAASVTAGRNYGLAVRLDGTLWGWGANLTGVLGDGTLGETVNCNENFSEVENIRREPVQALGLTGVSQASAAKLHALVVDQDGVVWAAGHNPNDMLGVGADVEMLPGDAVAKYTRVPGL